MNIPPEILQAIGILGAGVGAGVVLCLIPQYLGEFIGVWFTGVFEKLT